MCHYPCKTDNDGGNITSFFILVVKVDIYLSYSDKYA